MKALKAEVIPQQVMMRKITAGISKSNSWVGNTAGPGEQIIATSRQIGSQCESQQLASPSQVT